MKTIKSIYKNKVAALLLAVCFGCASCDDWFTIYPESETVLEDFWQDQNDVTSMVAACYRAMLEPSFMERVIVWGEVRSDNVLKGSGSNDNVSHFLNLQLTATNPYAQWGDFYKVINYCNTVIYYAPQVREKDPNYSETQLLNHIAEVKTIRALCYFILVRTFREIPFITDPSIDDTKPYIVAQSNPKDVLEYLIDDLKQVKAPDAFQNQFYDKGRITQKAVWTLIADMALWLDDYETCIEYCTKAEGVPGLELDLSLSFSRNVFIASNPKESIFELQFTGNLPNYVATEMYSHILSLGRTSSEHILSSYDFSKTSPELFSITDIRRTDFYLPNDNNGLFPIVKYMGHRARYDSNESNVYTYYSYCRKWIFYRLSDVYLMKAEALTERGGANDLEEAFSYVCKTYNRANLNRTGDLSFADYSSQTAMRQFVFDERQREFLFEGKRYYDLLRKIEREENLTGIVGTYLIPRKYVHLDQATVRSKLTDINALYMPVHTDELKANPLLVQNPFYDISNDVAKN
jgi:hypothetical protein